ncbi:MAG: hypothetical protein ABJF01_12840 [bacterium]
MNGHPDDSDSASDMWTTRFDDDIRHDTHVENVLIAKEWIAILVVALLVLVRRLAV